MIKLLIGGSPCTHWSIAKTRNRETRAEGMGWELFRCYLMAKEKFQPDYFLYENNQSAAQEIKNQISEELGFPLHYINSSLVSAQSRKRFYVHNLGEIGQPEDKGLILSDILDSEDEEIHYQLVNVSRAKNKNVTKRLGDTGSTGQANRVYSHEGKSTTLSANGGGGGANTGLYTVPVRLGDLGRRNQGYRVYSPEGKSITLSASNGGMTADTGAYLVPQEAEHKVEGIHEVRDGMIPTKNGVQPIDLPDGDYIIRKLKPVECERLQTLPDGYTEGIPKTQRYKCLGNGWTAEIISFILSHMNVPRDEEIVVLSMFDGIGTGRYVLDQLGYTNVKYFAYEIDPYAIQVAKKNYPDIIELGDAFDVMKDDWNPEDIIQENQTENYFTGAENAPAFLFGNR